ISIDARNQDTIEVQSERRSSQLETSKVTGQLSIIAVPIFDGSVLSLQKPKEASVGAVSEQMAPRFDRVARFDVIARNSNLFEPNATCGFKGPYLWLALCVLDFQVDPGMWDN